MFGVVSLHAIIALIGLARHYDSIGRNGDATGLLIMSGLLSVFQYVGVRLILGTVAAVVVDPSRRIADDAGVPAAVAMRLEIETARGIAWADVDEAGDPGDARASPAAGSWRRRVRRAPDLLASRDAALAIGVSVARVTSRIASPGAGACRHIRRWSNRGWRWPPRSPTDTQRSPRSSADDQRALAWHAGQPPLATPSP